MFIVNRIRITLLATMLATTQLLGCATDMRTTTSPYWSQHPDAAIENRPQRSPNGKTLCLMARILAHEGKDQQAEFALRRVLREHSSFMPAYCDLAQLQMRTGRVDEAIQTLTTAVGTSPNDPVLLNNLGLCLLLNEQPDRALTRFWEAAALRPRDARYRSNVAIALGLLGKYPESLYAYEGVVSSPAQAHYNLGVLCEARGDYRAAAQEYTRAGDLDRSLNVGPDLDRVHPRAGRVHTRGDG